MKKYVWLIGIFAAINANAQTDSTDLMATLEKGSNSNTGKTPLKVFISQKLINANTVEVLAKGHMEFKVQHNFGDVGGSNGGIQRFYGLDNASDIKIGFQVGLTDKLNILAARTRGGGQVQQMWELALKYQLMQQRLNDPAHPLSITLFANSVVSTQPKNVNAGNENSYVSTGDRMSYFAQLIMARKFGGVSIQLNPSFVRRNFVQVDDEKNIFALGGAVRLPLSKKFVLIADYFHPFRSSASRNALKARGVKLYDTFGIGFEIKTPGHIFHLNFTNATNLLENRFIPRTFTTWEQGQFRWGFTIGRDFIIFRDKRK